MSKGLSNKKYIISRKNPTTGFIEETVYTGNLKYKPTGWKVEECIGE